MAVYIERTTFVSVTVSISSHHEIITNQQREMLKLINFIILSSAIGVLGVLANIINMVVFYRQGFEVTINVAFLSLALSDLCCLLTLLWFNVCMNPLFEHADLDFVPGEVQYLAGGWLHVCFSRITGWITVFITAERCLGVALPLKVKRLISKRRTVVSVCLIYAINLLALCPQYCVSYLGWKFYPHKNRSLVGIINMDYSGHGESLVFILTSTSGIASFLAVLLLTAILVAKLDAKSRWRQKVTRQNQQTDQLSTRDKKTVKMVVLIAAVLIVCYAPGTAISMVTIFEPEFHLAGKYMNSFFATWSFAFVFQAINSSVNIFLYYSMSGKYKQTFHQVFTICSRAAPRVDLHSCQRQVSRQS